MPPKRKVKKAAPKGKKATKATSKTTTLQPENDAAREDHSEIVKVVEKHPTGFLDLPTEIRNVIYQLALIRYHNINIPDRKEAMTDRAHAGPPRAPVVLHEPALLATCHQVRLEALAVFYGGHTFSVQFALYGPKLVRQLGPERTAMLSSLRACGVEQARWVTPDRFMHAAVWHVNRLLEAAGGALRPDAVLVPVGHGAVGGWQRLTEAKDMLVVDDKGKVAAEWVGRDLQPAFSVFDW